MNKAFTRESDADDDDEPTPAPLPPGTKNYITPGGEAVHWAARNGDRSENGDYLYGKKRLREIDRRIRFLTKRLEIAEVTDPSAHHGSDQVFFGATVVYADPSGAERSITILGIDEADSSAGQVSWIAPIARALLRAREGDVVKLAAPGGMQEIEVLTVSYPAPTAG